MSDIFLRSPGIKPVARCCTGNPSILISTICFVAASIRTLTLASVTGIPEVPDTWPDLDAVLKYRDQVRSAVLEALDNMSRLESSDIMAQDGRAFEMVLEHEYMHQETLLYMMHELPLDKKNRPTKSPRYSFQSAARSCPTEIPERQSFTWRKVL